MKRLVRAQLINFAKCLFVTFLKVLINWVAILIFVDFGRRLVPDLGHHDIYQGLQDVKVKSHNYEEQLNAARLQRSETILSQTKLTELSVS